jgi:hypothetical protein
VQESVTLKFHGPRIMNFQFMFELGFFQSDGIHKSEF